MYNLYLYWYVLYVTSSAMSFMDPGHWLSLTGIHEGLGMYSQRPTHPAKLGTPSFSEHVVYALLAEVFTLSDVEYRL